MDDNDNVVVLINPVDHKLYFGREEGHRKVTVRDYDNHWIGAGYFTREYPSDELGMPRANTPNGVIKKRTGYGLMLYSSLAWLAADHGYEGVCSAEVSRSDEAHDWWMKEVRRGLAVEVNLGDKIEDTKRIRLNLGKIQGDRRDTVSGFLGLNRYYYDVEIVCVNLRGSVHFDHTDTYRNLDVHGETRHIRLHVEGNEETTIAELLGLSDDYDDVRNISGEMHGYVIFYRKHRCGIAQVLYYKAVIDSGFVLLDGMGQGPGDLPPEVLAGLDLRDVGDVDLIEGILEQLISGGVSWSTYQKFVRRNIPVWSQVEPYVPSRKKKALARNPQKPIRNQAAWKDFYGDFVNPGEGM